VGRLLRKSSLDELPQLINVFKGDMSLVGPRPALPYEVKMYEPWHARRLSAIPGITGLWQVGGRSEKNFKEMVELDLKYIDNWSVWLDMKILLKTFQVIFNRRGAW
jgi:lipopolysaccharide/colanic/teichoic acid biosynthesis glycosyltransferase